MSKFALLAAVAALSFGAPASSQDLPKFEFRGHFMGEPASNSFPYYTIDPNTCWVKKGFGPDKFDEAKCPLKMKDQPCNEDQDTVTIHCDEIPIFAGGKIADIRITQLRYSIYDGKIFGIKMLFASDDALKISDMLTGKYGKPSRTETVTRQNRAGANFNSLENEWDFAEGTLVFQQIAGRIDTGMVLFVNTDVEPQIEAIKAKRNQAAGISAF